MRRQTRQLILKFATAVAMATTAFVAFTPVSLAASGTIMSRVDIHQAPDANSPVVSPVDRGTTVDVRDCQADFCFVHTPVGDGYVAASAVARPEPEGGDTNPPGAPNGDNPPGSFSIGPGPNQNVPGQGGGAQVQNNGGGGQGGSQGTQGQNSGGGGQGGHGQNAGQGQNGGHGQGQNGGQGQNNGPNFGFQIQVGPDGSNRHNGPGYGNRHADDNQPEVCFYERTRFRGESFCAQEGDSIRRLGVWSDRISSIENEDGLEVRVCRNNDFRNCRIYDDSVSSLGSMDDDISSLQVR